MTDSLIDPGLGITTNANELVMTKALLEKLTEVLGPITEHNDMKGYTLVINEKLPPEVALFGGIPVRIEVTTGTSGKPLLNMLPAQLSMMASSQRN